MKRREKGLLTNSSRKKRKKKLREKKLLINYPAMRRDSWRTSLLPPRKIQKRKAEEEAKFDLDTFARDVRHSKREKKKVKALVEEIAKKTDLPANKIHDVIAKVHKANKAAVALAKGAVELPPEEPTRQSERLKEQAPVQKEKKERVRRKEVYFKTHKLTKEERKERKEARRKAISAIDLEQGFAKGHLPRDVEDTDLDDFLSGQL